MINRALSFFLIISFAATALPARAQQFSFNQSEIISDADFFRVGDMSVSDIQEFLGRKGSTLARYRAKDIDDVEKSAAQIIERAATDHRISPRVLLVLLQKEQSLIENPSPSRYNYDWATGYGVCDSCSVSDPALAPNKGFVTQVEKAASRKQEYITTPQRFRFRVGESALVDGRSITPQNLATAILYNYTPHFRGNFSFWKLWVRYFEKFYPDGTIVQAKESPDVWLVQDGVRRKFASRAAFLTRYSTASILSIEKGDLEKYPIGSSIAFPQYSLLQSKQGGIFLLVDEMKYIIPSKKIFKKIGFNPEEVMPASDADLALYPTAGLIREPDENPMGELVQDATTGGIYLLERGSKRPILEKAVLKANFLHRRIVKKSSVELESIPAGEPVLFPDGSLVTGHDSGAVYIISRGEKRPFLSADVFQSLGYQWSRIVRSSGATLALHPDGAALDLGKNIPDELPAELVQAITR